MLPKNEQVLRLGSGRRGPHPAIGAEDGAYIFPNGVRDDGRVLRLVPEFLVAQLAKVGAVVQDLINRAFVDGLALHSAFYQWVPRLGEAWPALMPTPERTCWRLLMIVPPTRPPSSPISYPLSIGMPGWEGWLICHLLTPEKPVEGIQAMPLIELADTVGLDRLHKAEPVRTGRLEKDQ